MANEVVNIASLNVAIINIKVKRGVRLYNLGLPLPELAIWGKFPFRKLVISLYDHLVRLQFVHAAPSGGLCNCAGGTPRKGGESLVLSILLQSFTGL